MINARIALGLCLLAGTVLAAEPLPFRHTTLPPEQRVEDLLQRLTLEEKANLCSGGTTAAQDERFSLGGVPRLGIGRLGFRDGPVGVRTFDQTPTTALPSTLALACTWDVDAAHEYGRVLGEEILALQKQVLFGPGVNLMRDPRGGRNFEYMGEDPFLTGTIATQYIRGAQELGVAADAKHLVANDYDSRRHFTSSNLDERTMREMHFLPFELAVREGHVWTVMVANSLVNGVHAGANRDLVQNLLKDRIGFDGFVITDWRAAYDTVPTALAGIDVTAGVCAYVFGQDHLLEAVKRGAVPVAVLDDKVRRILRTALRTGMLDAEGSRRAGALDSPDHRATARRLAAESIVLLKNANGLLPLDPARLKSVFVTGPGADYVAFGRGSGSVHSAFRTTPLEGLRHVLGQKVALVHRAWPNPPSAEAPGAAPVDVPAAPAKKGGREKRLRKAAAETHEAVQLSAADLQEARSADVVFFFAADVVHGEGSDLPDLNLPAGQAEAIQALAKVNPKVVVVLQTGQPVMVEPFVDQVPAVLGAWYLGEACGDAIADVVTGKVNPSAKLSMTFGRQLADYPCAALDLWPPRERPQHPKIDLSPNPANRHVNYAFDADYKEGVFIGYRWFDQKHIEPRFPFGYGLSYTKFEYSGLKVQRQGQGTRVTVVVKNTGERAGAEVVQVYVAPTAGAPVARPVRELRGFARVTLAPGESKPVTVSLRPSAFSYFDATVHQWRAPAGTYRLEVGASSRDIRLSSDVTLKEDALLEFY